MALENPGYEGWKWEPVTAEEAEDVKFLRDIFKSTLAQQKFPAAVADTLSIEFGKATLGPGAAHGFADGKPFYRLQITAQGKGLEDAMAGDPSAQLTIGLMVFLKSGSLSMGRPLVLTHDFRDEDTLVKGLQLAGAIQRLAPQILKP